MSNERSNTVALFGLPISDVTMAEAIGRVQQALLAPEMHQIATANLDFARNSLRDESLQRVICGCSMVLPDGAPIVWASKLLGKPLRERVTGVDLIPELAKLSAEKGYGIFLLGSDDKNAKEAAEILEDLHPGVNIAGRYSPPMRSLAEMDDAEILERIAAAKPQILLVAFGNPKQEHWIHRNHDKLGDIGVRVAVGIGGALEMIAGSLKRAPKWVQKLQMEWLFRLAQEPFRLLPRYVGDASALLRHLPVLLAVSRMQPLKNTPGGLMVSQRGGVRVVSTPATLTGEHCLELVGEANVAAGASQMIVIDMTATSRVEADGLGSLLHARRVILATGGDLCLAGVSNPVRRVLQFSAISDLFGQATVTADGVRFAPEADWNLNFVPEKVMQHHSRRSTVEAIEV